MSRHFLFLISILLLFCAGCSTQTIIVNGIPEREANEIVVLLASKGIQAVKTEVAVSAGQVSTAITYNISVPASQVTESLAILNHAGLPRVKGTSLLDLFGSKGLVPSALQDNIRYQEGLSEQLAATIRKMDGIIDANVQITFPKDEEEHKILTASVYVKHRGILDNPNSITITKIKRLVASAVPGLSIENVSVVSDRALYADITLAPVQEEMEHQFATVWSLIVEKSSVVWLRLILYLFIIFLFLFACSVAWLFWKSWPIIRRKGLWSVFSPHQYQPILPEEIEEESEEGGGGEG